MSHGNPKTCTKEAEESGDGEKTWSLPRPQKLRLLGLDDLSQFPPPKQHREAAEGGGGAGGGGNPTPLPAAAEYSELFLNFEF